MKDSNKIKIFIIAIIIAILSGIIYKSAIAPKLYDKYLNTGIKYLMDGEYEEAILAFDKAIKIEPKTTEARVYQAKAYVGNEELDKAVEVLEEAQNIDTTNEDLLKEILEILNEIDLDIAYEFLDRFIKAVGKDNMSQEIKDILDSAYEAPSEPIADPEPGTYVNPISVKLKLDKMMVGHSYYYTLDETTPNKGSQKYRGEIEITESTTIKLIGYNKNDESTEIITLEYIIDENILEDVKDSITEGENLIKDTVVGTDIGNISKKDKDKLQLIISEAKDLLNKDSVSYSNVNNMKNEIEDAIREFKNNIVKPTDKSKLKNIINEAENLYKNAKEGSNDGQYKSGSKSLLKSEIDKAKVVYDNKTAKQNEIDTKVEILNTAINKFKNSIIKEFDSSKAIQLVKEYTRRIHEDKRKEFEGIFIYKPYIEVDRNGIENGKKYYDILSGFDAYPIDGQPFYDAMYGEYVDKASAGQVYRVYENGYIDEMGHY